MGNFTGRETELSLLKEFFKKEEIYAVCVYGRLGIGKTALVREAVKGQKCVFFSASSTTDWGLVSDLARQMMDTAEDLAADKTMKMLAARNMCALSEYVKPSAAAAALLKDCKKAFAHLLEKIETLAAKDGIVFVIDSYPELVKAGDFAAILSAWAVECAPKKNIKLILISDSYNQAEKCVFSKKSAWGKIPVERMEIKELDFYSSRAFLGNAKAQDAVFYYGLTGGIPYYLNRISGHTASHADAIRAIFYDAETGRSMNASTILAQDLREFSYYTRLLTLLAAGNMRVNRISELFEKPKDIVVPYLTTLIGMGVVEKENSVTEKTNRRKTRYKIVNSYDLFYYKFIAVNMNLVANGRWEELTALIEENAADFIHTVMIDVCKEYLMLQSKRGTFEITLSEVGNWWENDEEAGTTQGFDLVALGAEGTDSYVFGRCYCEDKPVDISMLKNMLELTKRAPGGNEMRYMMFSANGFHENVVTASRAISNIKLVGLEDVVAVAW